MGRILLRVTEQLTSGARRTFRIGSSKSKTMILDLLSRQDIVGCLTLQFDDSGKSFVRLQHEQGFDFQINSFRQMKLLCFTREEVRKDV